MNGTEDAIEHLKNSDSPYLRILGEAAELHFRKGQDYGADDDPYANLRASGEWGIPTWVGCLIRQNDKLTRLKAFARRGSLANESARDSLIDNVNYAIFALMFYDEASSWKTVDPDRLQFRVSHEPRPPIEPPPWHMDQPDYE